VAYESGLDLKKNWKIFLNDGEKIDRSQFFNFFNPGILGFTQNDLECHEILASFKILQRNSYLRFNGLF